MVFIQVGPGLFTEEPTFKDPFYTVENLFLLGAGTEATYLRGRLQASGGQFSVSDMALSSLQSRYGGQVCIRRQPGGNNGDLLFRYEGAAPRGHACMADTGGTVHFLNSRIGFAGLYQHLLYANSEGVMYASAAAFTAHEGLTAGTFLRAGVWGRISLFSSTFEDMGCTVASAFRIFQGGSITSESLSPEEFFGGLPGVVHGERLALLGVSSMAFVSGYCRADGSLGRAAGVLSCQRTAPGTYAIVFANRVSTRDYAVLALCQDPGGRDVRVEVSERALTSMVVTCWREGVLTDAAFAFAVY